MLVDKISEESAGIVNNPAASEVVPGIKDLICITERPFDTVIAQIDRFNWEDGETYIQTANRIITNLPPNARVVDVGSGVFQEVARYIKKIRPDVTTFSLDPSLLIDPDMIASGEIIVFRNENNCDGVKIRDRVTYTTTDFLISGIESYVGSYAANNPTTGGLLSVSPKSILRTFGAQLSPTDALEIHQERMVSAAEYGGIPFIYPDFPTRLENIDWIIENHGPLYYIDPDDPHRYAYLKKIIDTLKTGGQADIFPWHIGSFFMDEYYCIEGGKEFEDDFSRKFGDLPAKIEIFYTSSSMGMVRPGLHILKEF